MNYNSRWWATSKVVLNKIPSLLNVKTDYSILPYFPFAYFYTGRLRKGY